MGSSRIQSKVRIAAVLLSATALVAACTGGVDDSQASAAPAAVPIDQTPATEEFRYKGFTVEEMADFYRGQTVSVVVPTSPGGGTDASARLLAEWMSKHTPGQPTIVVENVAGGGGYLGMNEYWFGRPKDGLHLLQSSSARAVGWVVGSADAEYDYSEFTGLWGNPSVGTVYVHADGPIQSISDLGSLTEPLFYAGGTATAGDLSLLLALHMLDVPVNAILGYSGRGPARIAFLQREADINYDAAIPYRNNILPLVDSGEVLPLFSLGFPDASGEVGRDPNYPDLPHIGEVYEELKGRAPEGLAWEAYKAVFPARTGLNNSMWIWKDAPPVAIAALQYGLEQLSADPEFDRARQALMGNYPVMIGEELEGSVRALFEARKHPSLEYLQYFLRQEYGAQF